jgi:hypothetical protein
MRVRHILTLVLMLIGITTISACGDTPTSPKEDAVMLVKASVTDTSWMDTYFLFGSGPIDSTSADLGLMWFGNVPWHLSEETIVSGDEDVIISVGPTEYLILPAREDTVTYTILSDWKPVETDDPATASISKAEIVFRVRKYERSGTGSFNPDSPLSIRTTILPVPAGNASASIKFGPENNDVAWLVRAWHRYHVRPNDSGSMTFDSRNGIRLSMGDGLFHPMPTKRATLEYSRYSTVAAARMASSTRQQTLR